MTSQTTTPTASHSSNAHVDPAAQVADAGFVPVQTRSERPHSFDPSDFGAPTGREVNWKHTPVARLSGLFAPATANDGVTYVFASGEQYRAAPLSVDTA